MQQSHNMGTPSAPGSERWMLDFQRMASVMLAAAVAGIAGGLVARLAMRGVALMLGQRGDFSVAGTLGIVIVFVLAAQVIGVLYLLTRRFLPPARARRMAVVAGTLLLLMLPLLILIASGDVPGVNYWLLAGLLLLFIPIPLLIGAAMVFGADAFERRFASAGSVQIGAGWAVALLVAALALLLNLVGYASGSIRHPLLATRLLFPSGVDFTQLHERAQIIALVVIFVWLGVAAWVVWRDGTKGYSPLRGLLLLCLPSFTLLASRELPMTLSWLPDSGWLLGAAQALGLASLLLLFMLGGSPLRMPDWMLVAIVGAWLVAAVWLIAAPVRAIVWMEWVVWGMLAFAGLLILAARVRVNQGGSVATALLATFTTLWLILWAGALVLPDMALRGMTGYQSALSAPLFWIPWLLIPLALAMSTVTAPRAQQNTQSKPVVA